MKTFKGILTAVVLLGILTGCGVKQVKVSGRVYVINRFDAVVNMPACEVVIYDEAALEQALAKCNAEIAAKRPDFQSRYATAKANDEAKKKQLKMDAEKVRQQSIAASSQQVNAIALSTAEDECKQNYQTYLVAKQQYADCSARKTIALGYEPSESQKYELQQATDSLADAYKTYQQSLQKVKDLKASMPQTQTTQPIDNAVSDNLEVQAAKIESQLSGVDVEGEASKIRAEWSAFTSGLLHFAIPASTVTTDGDGRFNVTLKKGSYIFISSGQRVVIDKTEKYFWFAKADYSKSGRSETIELNNDCELRAKDEALYGDGNNPLTNDDYMKRALKLDASLDSN